RCFGVAPGCIDPPGQVTAVQRIVGVEFGPKLLVAIDARVVEPAILAHAGELGGSTRIEIDRGDEGKLALRVHDDAVVVVFELNAIAHRQGKITYLWHQRRQRRFEAEKSGVEAWAV